MSWRRRDLGADSEALDRAFVRRCVTTEAVSAGYARALCGGALEFSAAWRQPTRSVAASTGSCCVCAERGGRSLQTARRTRMQA